MSEIKVNGKNHSTCPRCGCDDTFWNDSDADPDNDSAYFLMYCEGCKKHYQSVFRPVYQMCNTEDVD